MDGVCDEQEYRPQMAGLNSELEALVIPQIDMAREPSRFLRDLPEPWADATLPERYRLLTSVVDTVYVELENGPSILGYSPSPRSKNRWFFDDSKGKGTRRCHRLLNAASSI